MKIPTADCPVCGKNVRLKKNGALSHHTGKERDPVNTYFMKRCEGADKQP